MSNDLKYVLLPTIADRHRSPKFQPWRVTEKSSRAKYRERLKMKYPCNINTKNWKFVKDGLDDFRDGLPPPHEDIIIQGERSPGPVLLSENRRVKATASNVHDRLEEHQIYFSRELPAAERRRLTIDGYISTLLDHPMALFPHFSETLPPEIYDRMTQLLEAELLRSNGDEEYSFSTEQRDGLMSPRNTPPTRSGTSGLEKPRSETMPPTEEKIDSHEPSDYHITEPFPPNDQPSEESDSKTSSTRPGRNGIIYDESGNQWSAEEWERKEKNPYRWFIEKQREKQKAKGPSQDEQAASAMEVRLRDASDQFCDWLHDLGGDTNIDVDPAVVRNLFSTAYDTKPSLSVPIKIVETTRVPLELREGVQETMIPEQARAQATLPNLAALPDGSKSKENPSTGAASDRAARAQKYRYGAWYLPKDLWQRSPITDELQDPKLIKAQREDATRKREEQINARLAPLHGINAFKDYLQEKNVRRMPRLITDVEQYRRDHPRELVQPTGEPQAK